MSLREEIINLLRDNTLRTDKEIYLDMVFNKKYFFKAINPLVTIRQQCKSLIKDGKISKKEHNNCIYYYSTDIEPNLVLELTEEREIDDKMKEHEIKQEERILGKQEDIMKDIRNNDIKDSCKRLRNISVVIGVCSFVVSMINYLK